MTESELLDEFSSILSGLLMDDSIRLEMDTRREEVDGWDSFQYVNFIVAVEMKFNIKFRVADVESFATVGDIVKDAVNLLNPQNS